MPLWTQQEQEQQSRIEGMQQEAGGVMASGIQSEEFTIEGVGSPGQRVPIGFFRGRQRPAQCRQRQSSFHVLVFYDVRLVVVIDERIAQSRRVDCGRCDDQSQRQQPGSLVHREVSR